MVKYLARFWLVAIAVGWGFDLLFWNKPMGVSFAVFVGLCLLGGFILAASERRSPAFSSLLLVPVIVFFAVMSFMRLEPLSLFVDGVLVLFLMAVLAVTFAGGKWLSYGVVDYIRNLLTLAGHTLAGAVVAWSRREKSARNEQTNSRGRWMRQTLPALRGLAIALPVVIIFATLLASADPIFAEGIEDILVWFDLEKIPEYLFRAGYILVIAYALVGVYYHSLHTSQGEQVSAADKPLVAPFLGFTEAAIVMGSVDLLFAAFVGVQFRYFFGGEGNIRIDGYTYAEYARKGFGELVAVAFFSLLLYLVLSALTRRDTTRQRNTYSLLGVGLTVLVIVILVSAFQRLMLYEQAYGFTRLRTYPHVFMIWLGLLLAALAALQVTGKLRHFALAGVIAAIGFAATVNIMNVDDFIVRQNVRAALTGEQLDTDYLLSLSPDAIPVLAEVYQHPGLAANPAGGEQLPAELVEQIRRQVGTVLMCQSLSIMPDEGETLPWQAYNASHQQAEHALAELLPQLDEDGFVLRKNMQGTWVVTVAGETTSCFYTIWD